MQRYVITLILDAQNFGLGLGLGLKHLPWPGLNRSALVLLTS